MVLVVCQSNRNAIGCADSKRDWRVSSRTFSLTKDGLGWVSDHVGGLLRMLRVSGRGQRDISADSGYVFHYTAWSFVPTRTDMRLFTLEIGAAQLCSVTEMAPKSPFLWVNRSPIWYGFRASACAKATRYGVNITSVTHIYHGGFRLHHDCSRLH